MATLGTLDNGLSSIVAGSNETSALTINSSAGIQFCNTGGNQLGGNCCISSTGIFNCMGLTISGPLTCSSIIVPSGGTFACLGSLTCNGINCNGTLYMNGNDIIGITTLSYVSDKNLKKNIECLNTCLDSVLLLKPCTFHYNTSSDDSKLNYGFIAQDVQEIYPDIISTININDEKYLGLSITDIIPILTKAIQELNTKIEILSSALSERGI